jgi:hypothetical protein
MLECPYYSSNANMRTFNKPAGLSHNIGLCCLLYLCTVFYCSNCQASEHFTARTVTDCGLSGLLHFGTFSYYYAASSLSFLSLDCWALLLSPVLYSIFFFFSYNNVEFVGFIEFSASLCYNIGLLTKKNLNC